MSAAYFTAAIPEPFQILGVRLKPLSLGRYRLLKRLNNAFVADGEAKAEAADLIIGVLVCSMRCDEFLDYFDSKDLKKQVRRWGCRVFPCAWIGALPLIGKWWRKKFGFDIYEKIQLFRRYIEEGSAVPRYFDESGNPSASGAHWSQGVDVTLRSEVNWSEDEVNESPLTKALSDYFKYLENQGLVRLMTDEDIAQGDTNAQVYLDYAKKCQEAGWQV